VWCSSAFQILLHDAGPILNERRDHIDQAVGQQIADPDEPATFTFFGQDLHRSAMVLERLVQHGIYDTPSRIIYTDYSLADDKSIGQCCFIFDFCAAEHLFLRSALQGHRQLRPYDRSLCDAIASTVDSVRSNPS
jgi:hypothetical protein